MKEFEVINNVIVLPPGQLTYEKKGGYEVFTVKGNTFALDINSLTLIRGAKENLPEASNEAPQFPFCPNRSVLALLFCLTHQCTLKCKYCYVDQLYPSQDRMTFAVAKQAFESLLNLTLVRQKGIRISFFGGEALLEFDLLKQIVEFVESKFDLSSMIKFSITTNGTLIDAEKASFLVKHNFSVVFSLDGPRELHDETRINKAGHGSFDDAFRGLTLLNKAGLKRITLRATFFSENPQIMRRLIYLNELCDQGMAVNVSIEPSTLTEGECTTQGIRKNNLSEGWDDFRPGKVEHEYIEATDWLIARLKENKPARFHNIMLYAERLLYRRKYCSDCGAGVGYLSVGPTGKIYACHRETNSRIGDLSSGGIDEELRAPWVDNRYYVNRECRKCALRNVCGGGCRENSIGSVGDIFDVDLVRCFFKRTWIHCAAYLLSELPADSRTSLIRQKNPQRVTLPSAKKEKINLVREAGGFGDIISIGGAVAQIKKDYPDTEICLCVPDDFTFVAKHLKGVDQVVGLGPLEILTKIRRSRNEPPDAKKHSYLQKVPSSGKCVDLWCPAQRYEQQEKSRIQKTRAQIFANLVCTNDDAAIPRWISTANERVQASMFLRETLGNKTSGNTGPTIALAVRGTKREKNLPADLTEKLIAWLIFNKTNLVWMDCVAPASNLVVWPNTEFCESVAILEQCDALISVDTGIFHAGVAARVPTVGIFGMTDGNPYIGFYPMTYIVQNESELEGICKLPCNASSEKGHVAGCAGLCARMENLSFEELKLAVLSALKAASNPEFQDYRLKLFSEK